MRILLFVLLSFPNLGQAATEFVCQRSTKLEIKLSKGDPGEFEVYPQSANFVLTTVSVSMGHPRNIVILKPDPDYLRGKNEKEFWLSCVFKMSGITNLDSDIYLTRKIPKRYSTCKRLKNGEVYYGISCE